MKKAYLVTEGQTDADILKKLLPGNIVRDTEFVVGAGLYSAQSLARSLLAVKQSPVALVLDAETTDKGAIQEKEEFYREALRQASSSVKFEVFLAEPEVETFFYQLPSFKEWLAKHYPKAERNPDSLHHKRLLNRNGQGVVSVEDILRDVDKKTVKAIQRSAFMNGLVKFLTSVVGKKK